MLIFGIVLNSNYIGKNIKVYCEYENISERNSIEIIDKFIGQLERYKNEYYNAIDNEILESNISFLDYIKFNDLKLFRGDFYILDFRLGNKVNPNNDKVIFYYSDESREGYYFYAKEYDRNIDLDIARIFRV